MPGIFGKFQQLGSRLDQFLHCFAGFCLSSRLRSLLHFTIGQPLDIEGKGGQFLCQFFLFIHDVLIIVLHLLGDLAFFFGCCFQIVLGLIYGAFGNFRELLLHGFVFDQFLFQLGEEFLR